MKKRIHLLFLLLLAVTFTAGAQYWSGEQYWADGIHYQATGENTVKVISVSGFSYSGDLVIPRTARITIYSATTSYYGEAYQHECMVTEIGDDAFSGCTGLTSVVLPNTIKKIGRNAFYGCTGLTSLNIPSGVTTIGQSAFSGCTGLTSMVIPNSVLSMDWGAFYGCTSLSSVTLSNNLAELRGTFQGCTSLTSVTVPMGVKSLDGTFGGCTSLSHVDLPRSVYNIGERTFENCGSLTSIRLPNSLEYVGTRAFANTGLTALELPDGVSYLDNSAFYGSLALTTISTRATNPPLMANQDGFSSETYSLANLLVPDFSLATYQSADWWRLFQNIVPDASLNDPYDFMSGGVYYAITGSNTVEVTYRDRNYNSYSGTVTIPARVAYRGVIYNVTGVGNSAFRGSTGLTTVSLPVGVTTIGKLAFYGSGLTAVNIPESVTAIGDSAYCNTSALGNLAALTIPENVANIGTNAFKGVGVQSLTWNARACVSNGGMTTSNMTQVTIGDEVAVLPDNFANGSSVTSVNLPESLTSIGSNAFLAVPLTSLTIPAGVSNIGENAFKNINVSQLTWNARECWSNGNMRTNDIRQLTIGDGVTVLPDRIAANSQITTLTIPNTVKHIGNDVFRDCLNLTCEVVIPDSVVEIGDYAFYGSGVTTMTVGKAVEMVGCVALNGVTSLTWNAVNCETMGIVYVDYFDTGNYRHQMIPLTQVTIGDGVERIPNHFAYMAQITSLELPQSVKVIGSHAFYDCDLMTNIQLPSSITTISDEAFNNCDGLSELIIPGSVKTIGYGAFSGCSGLSFVSIPASVEEVKGFAYCNNLTEASISALSIGEDAFYNCNNLRELTLSAPLQSIGTRAFQYCSSLQALSIPNTVTSIGGFCFMGCSDMESIVVADDNPVYDSRDHCNALMVTASDSLVLTCKNTVLPSNVTSIADYAFYNNTGLTSMTLPATVTSIGKYAFCGCSNLTDISIPDGVTTIGSYAFEGCSSLTSVRLPSALEALNYRVFANCPKLTSVTIPAATSRIDNTAFMGNTALESIVVSSANPVYDSREGCNAIIETASNTLTIGCNSSIIPSTVKAIGPVAFSNCRGLESVVIPDSVTFIGYRAFDGCSGLSSLTIGRSVNTIDSYAFYGCSALTRVEIKDLSAWCNISYWNYFSNPLYYAKHLYLNGTEVKDLVLPDDVTRVAADAFYNCAGLESVVIPNSVTSIGDYAFYGCSNLTSVTVVNSVNRIGSNAFYNCNNLQRVDIKDLGGWCNIGFMNSFSNPLYYARHLYLNGNEITDLVLPDELTKVKPYSFYGCLGITSVTIGESVTSVGSYAFYYCGNLRTVTCLAPTPPSVDNYWAFDNYYNSTLRVPQASLSDYRSAYVWKNFNTIVGIDVTRLGDVDGNGLLNICDVTLLVDMLLDGDEMLRSTAVDGSDTIPAVADVDGDGNLGIADVTALLDLLLNRDL